jgi:uncharacterized protein YjbI with pentapeptide repeats
MPSRRHDEPVVQPPVTVEPVWWRREKHGLAEWWVMGGSLEDRPFPLPEAKPGQLPNVFIVGAVLRNVDFSDLSFDALSIAGSVLENCRFGAVSLRRISFGGLQYHRDWRSPIDWSKPLTETSPRYRQTIYTSCTFASSKLPRRNTHFGNSRFDGCLFHDVLRSTTVDPLFTHSGEFVACKFTGRVSCVVFDGMVPTINVRRLGRATCQIVRNDFSEATLKTVDFRAVDLSENTLPRAFTVTG